MGLGNDVFNELKKTVINLDNDESDNALCVYINCGTAQFQAKTVQC